MSKSNIFGDRIRSRLKEMRQTQRWLAGQTDIAEQVISNIVNGRYENSGSIVHAVPIAKALQTSVDYLFGVTHNTGMPVYPSRQERRLLALAQMLPISDLDQLIKEVAAQVKEQEQEGWQDRLDAAVQSLLRQNNGDVGATIDAIDKIMNPKDEEGQGQICLLDFGPAETR